MVCSCHSQSKLVDISISDTPFPFIASGAQQAPGNKCGVQCTAHQAQRHLLDMLVN